MHASKFTKFKFIVRDPRVFRGIWFGFIYPHNPSLFFATPQIYVAADENKIYSPVLLWKILGDPGAVSRAGRKGATKVFKHRRKSPWVPTLTGPFPNGQANVGSWLGTKNALYYCAQSANSFSWVLFVSSYKTPIDSITACLAHVPKKCTQSGIFQFDINATFQNTGSLYTRA